MLYLLDSPQCISGFISSVEIKIQAREITRVRGYSNDERFFPDIGFTCNGNITHIIIGAQDDDGIEFSQIRFWRLSDEGEYEQTGSSYSLVYNNANDPSTTNLRWYNLSQPIQVQNGDVLGIYQPYFLDSDLILYYQENSGPLNHDENGNIEYDNDYPLVSVIFGKYLHDTLTCIISCVVFITIANTMSFTYETTSSLRMSDSETTGSPLNFSSTISKTTSSIISITSEAKSPIMSSITLSGDMSYTMSSTIDGMSFIMICSLVYYIYILHIIL